MLVLPFVPLASADPIQFSILPLSFVEVQKITGFRVSMHLPVDEIALVYSLVVVPENALPVSQALLELTLIVGLVFEDLFSMPMLLPIDPVPLVAPALLLADVDAMPVRLSLFPFTLVEVPVRHYENAVALDSVVVPLPLIVHVVVEHHQAEPITLFVDYLSHVAADIVLEYFLLVDGPVFVARIRADFMHVGVSGHEICILARAPFSRQRPCYSLTKTASLMVPVSQHNLFPISNVQLLNLLALATLYQSISKKRMKNLITGTFESFRVIRAQLRPKANYLKIKNNNNMSIKIVMQAQVCLTVIACLILITDSKFMKLQKITTEIGEDCWVTNTNNLTQIHIGHCREEIYFANLGLGTPVQYFNFQLDSFKDFMWFSINGTNSNYTSESLQISDKKKATVFNKNVYEGNIGSDIVSVQQTNIQTRTPIVWVSSPFDFVSPIVDGILGLGYSPTPNFLDSAAQNNQIQTSAFALQIAGLGQDSILYYNQLPSFLLQKNLYSPVMGAQFWELQVTNIKVGGVDFSYVIANRLIIDIGTSLLYLNSLLYEKIFNKYFSSQCQYDQNRRLICPCNLTWPDIELIFDNVAVSIAPEIYLRIASREGLSCVPLIGQLQNNQGPLLLGMSLLRDYVVTFDKQNSRVGFNGRSVGTWKLAFIILELVMTGLMTMVLSYGVYVLMTVRRLRKPPKSKGKLRIGKQGAKMQMQLVSQFLQP